MVSLAGTWLHSSGGGVTAMITTALGTNLKPEGLVSFRRSCRPPRMCLVCLADSWICRVNPRMSDSLVKHADRPCPRLPPQWLLREGQSRHLHRTVRAYGNETVRLRPLSRGDVRLRQLVISTWWARYGERATRKAAVAARLPGLVLSAVAVMVMVRVRVAMVAMVVMLQETRCPWPCQR
eukprot:Rmarinus@m.19067